MHEGTQHGEEHNLEVTHLQKNMRRVTTTSIWICYPSRANRVFHILEKGLLGKVNHLRLIYPRCIVEDTHYIVNGYICPS
jgi:hypothetical protein